MVMKVDNEEIYSEVCLCHSLVPFVETKETGSGIAPVPQECEYRSPRALGAPGMRMLPA